MPRNRVRKTQIGLTDEAVMKAAVMSVLNGGLSVQSAALRHNIPRTTLRRYIKKCRDNDLNPDEPHFPKMCPNYDVRRIFSREEEAELSRYLIKCGRLHHGLPPNAAKRLAFDLAVANNKTIPDSWHKNSSAGKEWFTAFLKRNPTISLRTPESTSIARCMAFNKPIVYKFYDDLTVIYERYRSLGPNRIYNTDETALTTVQGSTRVIAQRGQRGVGHVTSSERGTLVTMCGAINALGNCVPPLLIFPRVNFKDYMIKNSPAGTIGAATPSGWISSAIFIQWMHHFIKYSKPTLDDPVLLIMDSHEAHLTYEVIRLAKDSGVILFTLPPHTSHKLQPLDKCVYGPLKRFYNDACRSWLASNPGKRITIYEIAELLNVAYPMAFTQKNCVSGFKHTGIFPLNKYIYDESEFLPAEVTDRSSTSDVTPVEATILLRQPTTPPNQNIPSTSMKSPVPGRSETFSINEEPISNFISPEMVRPYPKVDQSENVKNKSARKKKHSEVLTSTPIINSIQAAKMEKQRKESLKRRKVDIKNNNKQQKKKPIAELLESTSESECDMSDTDSDEISICSNISEEKLDLQVIEIKAFVLVKFMSKKSVKYFVGQVEAISADSTELVVNFLRRVGNKFVFPIMRDEASVKQEDVVKVISSSRVTTGGTTRLQNTYQFKINLDEYTVM